MTLINIRSNDDVGDGLRDLAEKADVMAELITELKKQVEQLEQEKGELEEDVATLEEALDKAKGEGDGQTLS